MVPKVSTQVISEESLTEEPNKLGSFGLSANNIVSLDKDIRCSVPTNDVKCYIANHCMVDQVHKKFLHQQIVKKIYTTPTKMTPKKCDGKFGIEVTEPIKAQPLKFSQQHFSKKRKDVGEIDVKILDRPIRCSTPTPSHDATILAGHIDFPSDLDNTMAACDDAENLLTVAETFIKPMEKEGSAENTKSKAKSQENRQDKTDYCTEWMATQSGVCTNNSDVAPSLYEPTVELSESLLNVTSVSRNTPPVKPKFVPPPKKESKPIIQPPIVQPPKKESKPIVQPPIVQPPKKENKPIVPPPKKENKPIDPPPKKERKSMVNFEKYENVSFM